MLLWVARFVCQRKSARGRYAVLASPIPAAAAETCSSELRTAGYLSNAWLTAACTVRDWAEQVAANITVISVVRLMVLTRAPPRVDLEGSSAFSLSTKS